MRSSLTVLALLPISVLTALPAFAQQPAPAQGQTVQTTVDEVLLDVVVRDKKGKPVADLKPEEFTILDDGAKQTLTSFRLVQGKEAVGKAGERTTLDPLRQIRLVTLAFEGITEPEQRKMARNAAVDLVKGDQGTNVFFSVVAINRRLLALQPFTNDRNAVVAAIDRATASLTAAKLIEESDAIKAELRRQLGDANPNVVGAAVEAANPPATTGPPPDPAKPILMRIMLGMLRMDAAMAGNDSRLSISALQSLVQGLQPMPGRKSILYFSTGMVVPPELNVPFQNLVGIANRANVTFYSLDTRGVMVERQNKASADQLAAAAGSSRTTSGVGDQVGAPSHPSFVTKEEVMASDDAETSARQNVQLFIRDLAESTGGFLIGDSNDLRAPLRQVNEEINGYYELSYRPAIQNYDGSFRKIKVDTARKNVVLHARSGYFALPPDLRASGVQVFEVPLLKAISDGKPSADIDYRAGAVLLDQKEDGTDVSVLVEVPLRTLQPKADPANTQTVRFSLGALVKDARGEVVQKVTRDRSLKVTADQLKMGNFVEKATISIPPGKYTLESAVMDRETAKIGVQKSEFTIAPRAKGVAISSLMGVRTYTPDAKGLTPSEPFQFQGGAIGPTLNTTVPKAPNSNLRLFFVVYQDPAISSPASVEIEFRQNGKTLQKAPLPLHAPDAQGRIPYVMTIPASAIPPGNYEVRATARQGDTAAQAATSVKIEAM